MSLLIILGMSSSFSHCYINHYIFDANSVEPNQMPQSVASDLGLHCLPMSFLWDVECLKSHLTY